MNHTVLAAIRFVVSRVTPSDLDRDALIGDLDEEHAERLAVEGRVRADRWFVSQSVRSIPPLLRARAADRAFRRTAAAIVLGWLVWAAVFAALTAASVSLFRWVPTPSGLRVLAYLGIAFLAAATGAHVIQRSVPGRGLGATAFLTVLLIASVGTIFVASPEPEALTMWLVWTTALVGGAFAGSRSRTHQPWRSAS